jgi:DNA-binding beta-propeller fold protein YncE
MKKFISSFVLIVLLFSMPLLLSKSTFCQEPHTFVLKWGSYGSGDGQFMNPRGVAVDSQGNVYVTDTFNHRIQKFDPDGNFITQWGLSGFGDGQFYLPIVAATDSNDYVYVADTWNHRIQKFDSSGNFITKWGSYGSGDGFFYAPHGIIADSSGDIYVADTLNDRIQKFDSSGNFITKWGSSGMGDSQFNQPHGIFVDPNDNVYVTDSWNHKVQKFDSDGNFIVQWGGFGNEDGFFGVANGITVDSEAFVYVADCWNNRIQKFDPDGIFITKWGNYGSGDGQFYYPDGIAIDSEGNIYVADELNHRIQKFAPPYNTPPGEDIFVIPEDPNTGEAPIGISFTNVTIGGETTLDITETGAPPDLGFKIGNPPTYYEIETTAEYSGPITICIEYTGISFAQEENLRLFHQELGGVWTDITTSLDTENNIICGETTSLSPFAIFESILEVDIDIKPGSYPNAINLGSKGNVPVAIFSTDDFDAATVDPTTVTLAGADVMLRGKGTPMAELEDIDGDGLLDIVIHVDTSALGLSPGDVEAILEGETLEGFLFWGVDSIKIIND